MFKKIINISLAINLILSLIITVNADDNNEVLLEEDLIEVSNSVTDSEEEPDLNARIAVAYDRKSGRVIFGKDENKRTAMASTTKIMTATILIENCDLNQMVTISR